MMHGPMNVKITSSALAGKDSQVLCGNWRTVCSGMWRDMVWQKVTKFQRNLLPPSSK